MRLHEKPIEWYVDRLARGDHFSLAGYSDAEWLCVLGYRLGETTGLGQVISAEHGDLLADVLHRRRRDKRFLFAVPKCLVDASRPVFGDGCIDWWLGHNDLRIEAYERDMVTDDLARGAGLYPFIKQLKQTETVVIGPRPLRGLYFLGFRHFVEISTPNLHLERGGIDRAVGEALIYKRPAAYLVSAGVSAAVIIDRLHDEAPRGSSLIDCGSIWDAFVGIGGQREWRAKLYANPQEWERWKRKNLKGRED